eukprot:m.167052 g.167052  ORF g.167052 m.167052 type:complete len:661 (-) comp24077_c1_seq1:140-2122(-)
MDTTNPTTTVDRTESYTDAVVETDAAQDGTAVATTTDAPTTKPTTKAATEEDKATAAAEHAESAEKDEAGKAEAGDVTVNVPPTPPPFRFFKLLGGVNKKVLALKKYPVFLVKFLLMQLIRIAAALSFVVAAYIIADDFDVENISNDQYSAFAVLGVLYVIGSMVPFIGAMTIDNLKESLQAEQATAVVAKIFDMQYDAMVTTPTGEFVQLISKVFRNLDTLLPALYGAIIPVAIETFIAVIVIGALYGPICLMQLGLYVVYTLVAYRSAGRKAQRNNEVMMVMFSEWGKIMDTATAYERAHFFGNVKYEVGRSAASFDRIGVKVTALTSNEHKEGMVLNAISISLTVVFILVLPLVDISGIELAALALYFLIFISSMSAYAVGISNLRSAIQEYQAFDEYTSRKSEIDDVEGAIDLELHPNPVIEFKNVTFSYGGKDILDNVSFKVGGGETLGLVGSSGCGKSTILRLLLRFYRPTSGTITIDGNDIALVTGDSLRRLFSVMPQDADLFNISIRDNIAYGKMGSSDAEIIEAAKKAELPLGTDGNDLTLDKVCGEKGAKLSGGQQQRVALARAMLKNGSIYLLDEPTTALDGVVAQNLQKTLDELCTDATTICITHHLTDLKTADQIIYLKEGKIVEQGNYDTLLAKGGAFSAQVDARQ